MAKTIQAPVDDYNEGQILDSKAEISPEITRRGRCRTSQGAVAFVYKESAVYGRKAVGLMEVYDNAR